jgi:hypothetical protein
MERGNKILLTVVGFKLDILWLTTCPTAENSLSTAAELHGIEYIRHANFDKCAKKLFVFLQK